MSLQPSAQQKARRRGTKFVRKPGKPIPYTIRHTFIHGQWVDVKVYRALTEEEALDPEIGMVLPKWKSGTEW